MFSTNSNLIRSGHCTFSLPFMKRKAGGCWIWTCWLGWWERKNKQLLLSTVASAPCALLDLGNLNTFTIGSGLRRSQMQDIYEIIYPTTTLCSMDFIHSFRRIWEPTPLGGWALRGGVMRGPSKGLQLNRWLNFSSQYINFSSALLCCALLFAMINYYFLGLFSYVCIWFSIVHH
jgi:hypothetical protein